MLWNSCGYWTTHVFFPISDCLTGHLITHCAFYLTGYIMIHCEVHTQFKACHLTGHSCPTVHFILTGIPSPTRNVIPPGMSSLFKSSTTYLSIPLSPIPFNNPPILPLLQLQQSSHIFNNLPIIPHSNSTQQPTRSSSPITTVVSYLQQPTYCPSL